MPARDVANPTSSRWPTYCRLRFPNMAYKQNQGFEFDRDADYEHDLWVCFRCFKTVSPDRPPVLNLDNCSCSEVGTSVNDPNSAAKSHALSMAMDNLRLGVPTPPSTTSDEGSVRNPDGPEAKDPGNRYLQVAPAIGLGEVQHRRRASFDEVEDQLEISVRKYLKTLPQRERSFSLPWEGLNGGSWLKQNTHLVGPTDSVRATRGNGSGSGSGSGGMSSGYSAGSSGLASFTFDPTIGSGGWIGDSMYGILPMEIDDEAIHGDENDGRL